MLKRMYSLLLILVMVVTLTACSGEKQQGQMLDHDWIMRGDVNGIGEDEKWYKGFAESNDEKATINWYANKFHASLINGDRVVLSASDLGYESTLWLNGKQIDSREGASGCFYVDVTDTIKKNGTNMLVLRAKGNPDVDGIGVSVRPKMTVAEVKSSTNGDAVTVTAVMDNSGAQDEVAFVVEMTALDSGKLFTRMTEKVTVKEGVSEQTFTLTVPDHDKWTTDYACLYKVSVEAKTVNSTDTVHTCVGFADLTKDEEGYFKLNGETTFLRVVDLPERVLADDITMRRFVDYIRTAEFNAVYPLVAPTKALLDYCDQTGIMVLVDSSAATVRGADSHVSYMAVDASSLTVIGENLQFAAEKPLETLETMYKEMELNRIYGGAVDLYNAMGDVYVAQLSSAIRDARKSGSPAIRIAAPLDGYPDAQLLSVTDGIEELRYILSVDPVIGKGESVSVNLDLVDVDVLWGKTKFNAYIKITNDKGIVWDKTVEFVSQESALGHAQSYIPLVHEMVPINGDVGKYTVAVELTDLAHPVCGETEFYVVSKPDLKQATIVNGMLTPEAKAKAEAGGKVIVLNASAESALPFEAEFVDGITGAVVDNRVQAGFAGTAIASMNGVGFDRAIQAQGGTSYLTGFGLTTEGVLTYGSVIATYPVGSGSITVVTADVDISNPVVAAVLSTAIS